MSETPAAQQGKLTLDDILYRLNQFDDGLVEFDPEAMADTMEDFKEKIDSYKAVHDAYAMRIKFLKEHVKEVQERVKSLENNRERLKNHLVYICNKYGIDKAAGNVWNLAVRASKRVKTLREPGPSDYLQNPELVRRSYAWNKTNLKNILTKENKDYDFAEIEINETANFSLRNK